MHHFKTFRFITLMFTGMAISACGQSEDTAINAEVENAVPAAIEADPAISVYAAALANPTRPDADRARDAARNPAEVLEFLGIAPGMTTLDMFSGGGWYAEIIAHVVGENGALFAHTNQAYRNYVGEALAERFSEDRLPQVKIINAENNQLSLDENSLDAVTLIQSFHDIYHVDPDNKWAEIDGPAFLVELKKGLKPGGIVGIVDHCAAAGAPPETGETLHRIDPELVMTLMEEAGFIFEASSDLLRNPDDDHSQSVFAEGLRGNTDRFVLRFRNPG